MTSGGKREGAGRPKIKNRGKPVQFYLKPATIKLIGKLAAKHFAGNKSAAIEQVVLIADSVLKAESISIGVAN